MAFAQCYWQQYFNVLAPQLICRVAEQLLYCGIGKRYQAIPVDADDTIRRILKQFIQLAGVLLQCQVSLPQLLDGFADAVQKYRPIQVGVCKRLVNMSDKITQVRHILIKQEKAFAGRHQCHRHNQCT